MSQSSAAGHPPSQEELVEQGVSVSEARRLAVQASLRAALEASFERWGALWLCALAALVLGMLCVAVWADRVCEAHRDDRCDQPLALMLRLLSLILVVLTFQQAIIRNLLCYSMSRDGPVAPCRVVCFRRSSMLATVLWPIVGYWMLSHAHNCSTELKTAVRVITGYYMIVALVVLVVPGCFIGVMLFLIRHRLIRMPRSRHAAPDDLITKLPKLKYDPGLFNDRCGPGCYPSECPICLDAFGPDRQITRTPCQPNNHAFHTDCLRGWLQCARTCPLCRTDLTDLADSDPEDQSGSSSGSESLSDSETGGSSEEDEYSR